MSGAPSHGCELSVILGDEHPAAPCAHKRATRRAPADAPIPYHLTGHLTRAGHLPPAHDSLKHAPCPWIGTGALRSSTSLPHVKGVPACLPGFMAPVRPRTGAASTRLTRANRSRRGMPHTPLGATRTAVHGHPTPSHHGLDRSQIRACNRYAHTSREKNNVPLYSANLHPA